MGPESLVDDVEESAAVELVVFDCTQVPHLGLNHRLTHPIGLWNIRELIGKFLLMLLLLSVNFFIGGDYSSFLRLLHISLLKAIIIGVCTVDLGC